MDTLNILALNSGSSSLKFGLYRVTSAQTEMLFSDEAEPGDITHIAARLAESGMPAPDAIGHRIVHGGPRLRRHCLIDKPVLQQLEAAIPFAPLHVPASLAIIHYAQEHFPDIPQVACFDTAFHAEMPDVAHVLPIPKELRTEGIQRYGFHGLSCESIVDQLGNDLPDRADPQRRRDHGYAQRRS
jgi:acetate kinase